MTTAEREELDRMRAWVKDGYTTVTTSHLCRRVELERMDAAEKAQCILCDVERNAVTESDVDMEQWVLEHAEQRAMQKWNAQADNYNQWRDLGQDEKDALIVAELAACAAR
jgi:hypothetical protein